MKWFLNPLMVRLLRSRRHAWVSGKMLLLTYRGRKSGKMFTLPVQYAREGELVIIIPAMPERKKWWRNLRGGAGVELLLAGKKVDGQARILQGAGQAVEGSAALRAYLKAFPSAGLMLGVRRGLSEGEAEEALQRSATNSIIIEVVLEKEKNEKKPGQERN